MATELINNPEQRLIMFHKPKGVVVTRSDNLGRRTIYDCLPSWIKAGACSENYGIPKGEPH